MSKLKRMEVTHDKYAWKCTDCGNVWIGRGTARFCASRGHKDNFETRYGIEHSIRTEG